MQAPHYEKKPILGDPWNLIH